MRRTIRGPGKVQKRVLRILASHPESSYTLGFQRIRLELSGSSAGKRLQVRSGDLNRMLRQLERRGLLEQTVSNDGSRTIRRISLTEKGLRELASC